MGTSEFHGTVDVRMDLCICHMKFFIRTLYSPYRAERNVKFVHEEL